MTGEVRSYVGHAEVREQPVARPHRASSDANTEISLSQLAQHLRGEGQGLQVGAVLADGCKTAVGVWQKAFGECLQGDITYIGTSTEVGWYEFTAFAPDFYAALLATAVGVCAPPARPWMQRAALAYEQVTGKSCCCRAVTLKP